MRNKIEAVARCLAKLDDKFIGAEDWNSEVGDRYREKAKSVLLTIYKHDHGIRSGGLPHGRFNNPF